MTNQIIDRGLRALDAVKHCQDKMTPWELEHDTLMRNTPPDQWTEVQVDIAEQANYFVNEARTSRF
jgi:hypothetical protein